MVEATPALRVSRALHLAEKYPYAREALVFYAQLVPFTGDVEQLRALVLEHGPELLRASATNSAEPFLSFAERIFQRLRPCYFHLPQAAIVGGSEGSMIFCGVCLHQWRQVSTQCPNCDSKEIQYYSTESIPHIRTQLCDGCHRYLHIIDVGKDPAAVPDVDEIAALPLDVWSIENGYTKLHPNLIGI